MVRALGLGYTAGVHPRDRIAYRTEALKLAGLWREPAWGRGGAEGIETRSNDYLGLGSGGVSRETGFHTRGLLGAGASRVVSGTWQSHEALEAALSEWLGAESTLLFTSGYAANVGALSALVGPGETVISDSLNHASIIDGCRLSRAKTVIIPHGVPEALERVKMLPAASGAPGTRLRFGKFIRQGWVGSEYLVARRVLPDGSRSVLHATIEGLIRSGDAAP